jgi:ribonuclease R
MPESLTKGARPKPTKTSGAAGRKSTPSGLPMPNARDDRPAWRQPSGPPLRQAVTVEAHAVPAARTRREGAGKHNPRDPHAEREALRYERPIASREAILALLAEADGPLERRADRAASGLDWSRSVSMPLTKRLAAMLRDGQLLANRRGALRVSHSVWI